MTPPGLVIVTHNSKADVQRAIESARGAGFGHIVVADAGSTDGTAAALLAAHPDVHVLQLANLGYGACANEAVRSATTGDVVIANADVFFSPGAAPGFAAALAAPRVGIVGPLVRHTDGSRQLSARRHPGLLAALLHAILGLWWPANPWTRNYRGADLATDKPQDVDWVSGCCIGIRRPVFDELGGFDPAYFLFMEDVDLAFRAREAGHRVRFDPSIEVVHRVGGALDQDRPAARRAHARSMVRWARQRHGPVVAALVAVGVRGWLVSTAVYDRTRGRWRPSTGERSERP
ncbi:MAG: glycosyltransferase family 2 protein [Nitriliruptorales bacterium]|nr:glycosyltransferase family 2 protein [Nitriliruptorales bacterium]